MPTPTNYVYSIASDTLNGKVSVADLEQQIVDSDITIALTSAGILEDGDVLTIHFKDVLPDVSLLDDEVNNHDGVSYGSEESMRVRVQEQDDDPAKQVRGSYRGVGLKHEVPAGIGWSHTDFEFSFNVAMLDMEYTPTAEQQGDYFSVCVAPETIIGVITSDVAVDDTTFNVSPTVLENIEESYCVNLFDGVNSADCGFVKAGGIDSVAGTLSVDVGSEYAFAAATPTYVRMDIPVVEHVYLIGVSRVELGSSKIGGSFVPAGTKIRFKYYNVDGVAKVFHGILEVLC